MKKRKRKKREKRQFIDKCFDFCCDLEAEDNITGRICSIFLMVIFVITITIGVPVIVIMYSYGAVKEFLSGTPGEIFAVVCAIVLVFSLIAVCYFYGCVAYVTIPTLCSKIFGENNQRTSKAISYAFKIFVFCAFLLGVGYIWMFFYLVNYLEITSKQWKVDNVHQNVSVNN